MNEAFLTDTQDYYDSWNEESIDTYIENRRIEYLREWSQYLSEDMTKSELNNYLSTIF